MTATLETLGRSRELVTPALRAAVSRLDPHTRMVVSYHFGWCDETGTPLAGNGGKAVRPGLAMLAAEAAGGTPADALPGAVAVELIHNFSLVHDDLMDRDTRRRHRTTVWALWGDATAVLAGDAMLSLAHEVLLDSGSEFASDAGSVVTTATRELIRGQVQDTAFEQRDDVSLAECLDMASAKTGSLLAASAAIGAVLAGAPTATRAALSAYGAHVGLAFQLVDDLLGIWGLPDVTGKPVFSDLRSRKKSLPITWTIDNGGEHGRELAAWLADGTRADRADDAELAEVAALVEAGGGRAWTEAEARRRIDAADAALASASLASEPVAHLKSLARFIVERDA
ncbi:polyprenyl synthetase family protein [Rhodococcus sp. HNM0569]|uniref:polyprenyl synthetase family protein n=1 Tax=Rhodococcus sp. HNM0569 TaxID=2716340 RepID=UPI00146C683B|nr:polyprenyl synthetase family protein [Rhodococcus sp. HNM0569]NLU83464.1 polyprenyl synthetase family protein [Rhodococcus sp. HNM0569]